MGQPLSPFRIGKQAYVNLSIMNRRDTSTFYNNRRQTGGNGIKIEPEESPGWLLTVQKVSLNGRMPRAPTNNDVTPILHCSPPGW